jgi:hypothetical protein
MENNVGGPDVNMCPTGIAAKVAFGASFYCVNCFKEKRLMGEATWDIANAS